MTNQSTISGGAGCILKDGSWQRLTGWGLISTSRCPLKNKNIALSWMDYLIVLHGSIQMVKML